jgi:diacylglycerol kinase family enzyme
LTCKQKTRYHLNYEDLTNYDSSLNELVLFNKRLRSRPTTNADIRHSVMALREQCHTIDVRVTWENADMLRFIDEAIADNIQRVVIGGGDGSLNEALKALMQQPQQASSLEIAVLPLGSANDFVTACGIT